jgi:tetratricopeptide (TPR) repeat protein
VEKKFIFAPLKENADLDMAKDKKHGEDEVLVDVGQTITKAEQFFEENKQTISIVAIALFVLIGGYFAYAKFYQEPLEEEAQEAIFFAQQSFEQDSLKLALDGRGSNMGFLEVAETYGSTKAGNLASYYAGISYLNLGEYQKAIEHLDKFSSNDPIFSVIAKGAIGDAFLELNQPKEALEYYGKAVAGEENTFVVPVYLQRAALVAEAEGNNDLAKEYLTRLKKDFHESQEAVDVEKALARLEAKSAK